MGSNWLIENVLGQSQFDWLAPVLFGVVAFFAFWLGFMWGWKSAFYFFAFNLVGLVVGIFVAEPIILAIAPENKAYGASTTDVITSDMLISLSGVRRFIAPFFMGLFLILFNIVGLSLYFIFRRRLKRAIFSNKTVRRSNFAARSVGGLIAIVAYLPLIAVITNVGVIVSGPTSFSTFSDALVKGVNFGYSDGAGAYVEPFKRALNSINQKWISSVYAMMSGVDLTLLPNNSIVSDINTHHEDIAVIFNSPFSNDYVSLMFGWRPSEDIIQINQAIGNLAVKQTEIARFLIGKNSYDAMQAFLRGAQIRLSEVNAEKLMSLYFQYP